MFGVALSSIGQKPIFLWVAYNILVKFDQKTLCHEEYTTSHCMGYYEYGHNFSDE